MSPLSLGIPSQPRLLNPPTFTPYLSPTPPNQPPTFQHNPQLPAFLHNPLTTMLQTQHLPSAIPSNPQILKPIPLTLLLDPFSNWQWIPAWQCPMTRALWTPMPTLTSVTLPLPPTNPPALPPALGFWIPQLTTLVHQQLAHRHQGVFLGAYNIHLANKLMTDLPAVSSTTSNHRGTSGRDKANLEWPHLPESLDDAMLCGTGLLQDMINNTIP